MKFDLIIAIDPGKSGGCAHCKDGKTTVVKNPTDADGWLEYLTHLKDICENPIAFIEKVNMYQEDHENGRWFGIQKMMKGVEQLKTAMSFLKIPYIEVAAVSWQSFHRFKTKGLSDSERKNMFKESAQVKYPSIPITLWNADAILLLDMALMKVMFDREWMRDKLPEKYQKKFF